ncbi:MAG TPA: hypothetical protein VNM24_00360 [Burkholderiales bacterium]|nr:hypothetical protein [Burkholderiales bacterium]
MPSQVFPPTVHDLIAALGRRVGEARGIRAAELAAQLGCSERRLRTLISEAIEEHGTAICGHPSTGYYIAASAEELLRTIAFHRARALHELRKVSRLANIPLPDLLGQLRLETHGDVHRTHRAIGP